MNFSENELSILEEYQRRVRDASLTYSVTDKSSILRDSNGLVTDKSSILRDSCVSDASALPSASSFLPLGNPVDLDQAFRFSNGSLGGDEYVGEDMSFDIGNAVPAMGQSDRRQFDDQREVEQQESTLGMNEPNWETKKLFRNQADIPVRSSVRNDQADDQTPSMTNLRNSIIENVMQSTLIGATSTDTNAEYRSDWPSDASIIQQSVGQVLLQANSGVSSTVEAAGTSAQRSSSGRVLDRLPPFKVRLQDRVQMLRKKIECEKENLETVGKQPSPSTTGGRASCGTTLQRTLTRQKAGGKWCVGTDPAKSIGNGHPKVVENRDTSVNDLTRDSVHSTRDLHSISTRDHVGSNSTKDLSSSFHTAKSSNVCHECDISFSDTLKRGQDPIFYSEIPRLDYNAFQSVDLGDSIPIGGSVSRAQKIDVSRAESQNNSRIEPSNVSKTNASQLENSTLSMLTSFCTPLRNEYLKKNITKAQRNNSKNPIRKNSPTMHQSTPKLLSPSEESGSPVLNEHSPFAEASVEDQSLFRDQPSESPCQDHYGNLASGKQYGNSSSVQHPSESPFTDGQGHSLLMKGYESSSRIEDDFNHATSKKNEEESRPNGYIVPPEYYAEFDSSRMEPMSSERHNGYHGRRFSEPPVCSSSYGYPISYPRSVHFSAAGRHPYDIERYPYVKDGYPPCDDRCPSFTDGYPSLVDRYQRLFDRQGGFRTYGHAEYDHGQPRYDFSPNPNTIVPHPIAGNHEGDFFLSRYNLSDRYFIGSLRGCGDSIDVTPKKGKKKKRKTHAPTVNPPPDSCRRQSSLPSYNTSSRQTTHSRKETVLKAHTLSEKPVSRRSRSSDHLPLKFERHGRLSLCREPVISRDGTRTTRVGESYRQPTTVLAEAQRAKSKPKKVFRRSNSKTERVYSHNSRPERAYSHNSRPERSRSQNVKPWMRTQSHQSRIPGKVHSDIPLRSVSKGTHFLPESDPCHMACDYQNRSPYAAPISPYAALFTPYVAPTSRPIQLGNVTRQPGVVDSTWRQPSFNAAPKTTDVSESFLDEIKDRILGGYKQQHVDTAARQVSRVQEWSRSRIQDDNVSPVHLMVATNPSGKTGHFSNTLQQSPYKRSAITPSVVDLRMPSTRFYPPSRSSFNPHVQSSFNPHVQSSFNPHVQPSFNPQVGSSIHKPSVASVYNIVPANPDLHEAYATAYMQESLLERLRARKRR